jgi:transcriptional regulator with XRE-family HTH domain
MRDPITDVGEFIRQQRQRSALSVRKLADLAGISNPYLSQIERGLRKPSADILKSVAKGLSISAETLYERAGLMDDKERPTVADAIANDLALTPKQKQALLQVYRSFANTKEE